MLRPPEEDPKEDVGPDVHQARVLPPAKVGEPTPSVGEARVEWERVLLPPPLGPEAEGMPFEPALQNEELLVTLALRVTATPQP